MPNKIVEKHAKLKGFAQHGVSFTKIVNDDRGIGTCPFCMTQEKFDAHVETMIWGCKKCGINGNFETFLMHCMDKYLAMFKGQTTALLAESRGLRPQTLRAWNMGWEGDFYAIPCDGNPERKVTDIQRYYIKSGKALSTSGSKKSMFFPGELTKSQKVWICEGPWDGMAMWECLRKSKIKDDVIAAPSASVFPKTCVEMLYDKDVVVIFDKDKAGINGCQRIYNLLKDTARSLQFVNWPEALPDNFDFRDVYLAEETNSEKVLERIYKYLKPTPPAQPGQTDAPGREEKPVVLDGEGMEPDDVAKNFQQWLHLPNTEVLDVMFGAVFANRLPIDPLWMFLVAPPGGSKTELLMSLSEAPLIFTTTSLTPHSLISGANFAGGGDPSLIPKLNNKVLVIKDFTTILSMNSLARDEIFGVLRDIYDGKTEKYFGNGVVRKYKSKFGILAGVTPVIEGMAQSSVLGERFLKYKIKQPGKINVGEDVIRRALKNVAKEIKMRSGLTTISKMVLNRPITEEDTPDIPDPMIDKFVKLSQWVASLRGMVSREKYTNQINFKPVAEIGTRLAKQFAALAIGISIYKNEKIVSWDTYQTVVHVAQDTAPDRVEEIVKCLYIRSMEEFASTKEISNWSKFPSGTLNCILPDLVLLGIVEKDPQSHKGMWKLTPSIVKIMKYLNVYADARAWKNEVRQKRVQRVSE